ncbi:hypothetical protein AB3S75_014224 [Citrus x aurantiifolia]
MESQQRSFDQHEDESKSSMGSEPKITLTQEQIELAMYAIAYIKAREKEMAEKQAAEGAEEAKPAEKSNDGSSSTPVATIHEVNKL